MSVICDSYFDESYDTLTYLFYDGGWDGIGQAFSGNGGKLETAQFYMKHSNAAAGTAYAKIYHIMWTFGSSAVPYYPPTPLATSDPVDVSTISDDRGLVTFTFSGVNQIILGATTKYIVTLEVETVSVHPDYLYAYVHHTVDGVEPTHPGNACSKSPGMPWGYGVGQEPRDTLFYVYTDTPTFIDIISNNSIISVKR